MTNFKDMPISKKSNLFFVLDYVNDPESLPFKINADFLVYNCYKESDREMMVSYYPMMPLLEKNVPFENADYILYSHCYARIRDMSDVVLRQLKYIDKHRKSGAEIIVIGKSANIESILNSSIDNITFFNDHFTEKLGKKIPYRYQRRICCLCRFYRCFKYLASEWMQQKVCLLPSHLYGY